MHTVKYIIINKLQFCIADTVYEPKWVYFRQQSTVPGREIAEGSAIAEHAFIGRAGERKPERLLDGFNPEIAQAREANQKAARSRTTVVQIWLGMTAHKCGRDNPVTHQSLDISK